MWNKLSAYLNNVPKNNHTLRSPCFQVMENWRMACLKLSIANDPETENKSGHPLNILSKIQ